MIEEQTTALDMLLPFLSRIAHLLTDQDISEVMVNANGSVFYEIDGEMRREMTTYPNAELEAGARRIARMFGRDVDWREPLFEGRLADGSRVAIVMPPCSVGGTTLTVRKFQFKKWDMSSLVLANTFTVEQRDVLLKAVVDRKNILISGGTGVGKSTLLNALSTHIPMDARVVVIETVNELRLVQDNVVYLEEREADRQLGVEAVDVSDLLRKALRLRPDRIIVGEVRGAEAYYLLQTLLTGHRGSLATIHGESCVQALSRLRSCVAMAGINLPPASVARMIADLVGVVVQLSRDGSQRKVTEIREVKGYDAAEDRFELA